MIGEFAFALVGLLVVWAIEEYDLRRRRGSRNTDVRTVLD